MLIQLLPRAVGRSAASPAEPLRSALRASGEVALCPRAVLRYMVDQARLHTSCRFWRAVGPKCLTITGSETLRDFVGFAVLASVLALVVTVAGWLCGFIGGLAAIIALGALVASALATPVIDFIDQRLPPVYNSSWRVVSLEERFGRIGRDALPEELWPVANELRARCPGVELCVHELDVDPVLEAKLGDERYYLGVWDRDGRNAKLVELPAIEL